MGLILNISLLALTVASAFGIDPFDYNPVDEVQEVCKAFNLKDDIGMGIDLKSGMSYSEMIWLAVWNMKFNFREGMSPKLKFDHIKWRIPIINHIFSIFKVQCSTEFVPHAFLDVLKQLILIYYNSEKSVKPPLPTRWMNTLLTLHRCLNESTPLFVEGAGLLIDNLIMQDEPVSLLPPHEVADDIEGIDLIVDSFWWIFSHSFGACYSPASYRSSWAPRYKKLFYEDFIVPLLSRWSITGPLTDFGFIFGNFDVKLMLSNIRFCVTAAYTKLGIADRQLIRPYNFHMSPNFKTGDVAV